MLARRSHLISAAMRLSCIALSALFLQGCAFDRYLPPVTFRVYDGKTGAPLAGVVLRHFSADRNVYLCCKPQPQIIDVTYPPSGADGILRPQPMRLRMAHEFCFSKPGYAATEASVSGPEFIMATDTETADTWSLSKKRAWNFSDVVQIPMYRD